MFRTRYIKSLMILAAAVAVACTDDPVDPADSAGTDPVEGAEPASLTINFSIADLGVDVSTRAGAGDSNVSENTETTDPTTPTTGTSGTLLSDNDVFGSADMMNPDNPWPDLREWDEGGPNSNSEFNHKVIEASLVDGSSITCLTVILVHRRTNKIVGVRRIPDPDCPCHEVKYLEGEEAYPPKPGTTAEEEARLNCILKEDGSLAEVLRGADGKPVLDNEVDKHITGLFGKKACVTFNYEKPIHIVDQDMLEMCAKKVYPNDVDAAEREKYIEANKTYINESAEKLLRGEYTVFVIANYDHRVTTASVEGIDGEDFYTLNVDETLEKLANDFHKPVNMANGLGPFAPDKTNSANYEYLYNLRFLMNRTLAPDGEEYKVVDLGTEGNKFMPYIRPAVHQTLTAAKDIYLEAGNNVIDMELLRIASRTRVEVKNYGDKDLQVNSLKFSPNYTQSTCYLFRRNKNDRDYSELASKKDDTPGNTGKYTDHDGKGAPVVEYTGIYNHFGGKTYGAIVPFVKDWNSDGDPENKMDGVRVKRKEKRCIFDALMYESHLEYEDISQSPKLNSFTYTIDVSYPEVKALDANGDGDTDDEGDIKGYTTTDINKIDTKRTYLTYENTGFDYMIKDADGRYLTGFGDKNGLYKLMTNDVYKGNYFLIQGVQTNQYLYERWGDEGKLCAMKMDEGAMLLDLEAGTINGVEIERFLWSIDLGMASTGFFGPKYPICKSIKNLYSGKYMNAIPKNAAGMNADSNPHQYQLQVIGNNVAFSSSYKDDTYYLNVYGGGTELGGWNGTDEGSQFRLYPVKSVSTYEGTPRMNKEVELTAFSDAMGHAEKVREIRRNDFIRILVEVSYNTKKGDFEFKVKPWDARKEDVEFH